MWHLILVYGSYILTLCVCLYSNDCGLKRYGAACGGAYSLGCYRLEECAVSKLHVWKQIYGTGVLFMKDAPSLKQNLWHGACCIQTLVYGTGRAEYKHWKSIYGLGYVLIGWIMGWYCSRFVYETNLSLIHMVKINTGSVLSWHRLQLRIMKLRW